jgi:UDP-N-acetylmuramoyl-tripeptide--D-alanyl-D-alanine ligase
MSVQATQWVVDFRKKAGLAYDAYVLNGIVEPRRVQRHLFFWARFVLQKKKPLIIGITGSVGKSTTTEIVSAVLMHPAAEVVIGKVGKASNNMNNHDGLPLVVLGFHDFVKGPVNTLLLMLLLPLRAMRLVLSRRFPKVLVLEYGTDRSGYLERMVDLAPPDIAIITAIAPAHLEGMGSMEGIVREKSSLLRGPRPPRLAILGEDHEFIEQLVACACSPVVRLPGRGVALARRIAGVLCEHLGVPAIALNDAAELKAPERRLEWMEVNGIRILDDSYNANPASMRLGLDTLAAEREAHRRVAVLGSMGELGAHAARYHTEVGQHARTCADFVVGVGSLASHYAPDVLFPDSDACAAAARDLLVRGDVVLVKGSASVGMNKIVERLRSSTLQPRRGTDALGREIRRLAATVDGPIAVAAIHLESDRHVGVNGNQSFPMASLVKLPLAVTLLSQVDAGRVDPDSMIEVKVADLVVGSGLLQMAFKQPQVVLSVLSLIDLMLVASDNSASDILLRLAGGPATVNEQMHRLGIRDIRIDRSTATLIADFETNNLRFLKDRRDTATPEGITNLLAQVWRGRVLQPKTSALLLDAMRRCQTGPDRIPALLPRGTEVAHKTGTLGAIANDVGIITLPDGSHVAIAVLSACEKATEAQRNRAIAEMARAAFDYFLFAT